MPFAHIGGLIAGLLKPVRHGLYVFRQGQVVAEAAQLRGPLSRLEHGAAGAADGLRTVRLLKAHAVGGQRVQTGRDGQRLAHAAQRIPSLLVGEIKQDVRSHRDHSLIAPAVSPEIKYLCRKIKATSTGSAALTVAAITFPQS